MKNLLSSLLEMERNLAQRNHSNICGHTTSNTVIIVFCNTTLVRVNAAIVALQHFHHKVIKTVRNVEGPHFPNNSFIQGYIVLWHSWCNRSPYLIQRRYGISYIVSSFRPGDQGPLTLLGHYNGLLLEDTKAFPETRKYIFKISC